jgi:methylated-DNA-[protein]-cysteine S-methyltransferase
MVVQAEFERKESQAARTSGRTFMDTSLGPLMIEASERGLTRIELVHSESTAPGTEPAPGSVLETAARQLREYFAGSRRRFDLPFDIEASDFERRVRDAAVSVDYGSTISYGELAELAGSPRAARAAGNVMRNNPLMIVIPCHRVIGADGSLRGYGGLGCGLSVKRWLIDFESSRVS